jgi:hypothetical protein
MLPADTTRTLHLGNILAVPVSIIILLVIVAGPA